MTDLELRELACRVTDLERDNRAHNIQTSKIPARQMGGGGGLPRGTGRGKVLILIDDLNPGTWAVDYPAFH